MKTWHILIKSEDGALLSTEVEAETALGAVHKGQDIWLDELSTPWDSVTQISVTEKE